jgi:hypothetical protein
MQKFTAIIQQHKDIDGAYIEPPFDVEEIFGSKRVKVKASFDGIEYRGSIVRMGGIYMLGMTKEIRKRINKEFGESVEVILEKDEEDRTVEIPSDFSMLLEQNTEAKSTYDKLSFTAKKEYISWITSAKKAETRQSRLTQALIKLGEGKN